MLIGLCNEKGLDLFVTEIGNDGWKKALLRHGSIEDQEGDVQINKNVWVKQNKSKSLKFEEYQDELIEVSEFEAYQKLKKFCIEEVISIFNSWGAEVKVKDSEDYIKEIKAVSGEERYTVKINYLIVLNLMKLRSENKLEEYLKESKSAGFGYY